MQKLPTKGLYNFKLRIRKSALQPKWFVVKRRVGILQYKKSMPEVEGKIAELEVLLRKSWKELDRMLYCSKVPMCVIRYQKKYRVGKTEMKANLIQSLTITLHQIKDITRRLNKMRII